MKTLRTPDERFADLPDYAFEPHYLEINDGDGGTLRVHYIDEGPADAAPVLLMHGEPSWSFLYRHMIPMLVAAGHRVVAPDLVGFGRSDKPTEVTDYSYARHVAWMADALFGHLDLTDITYFGQDWGGMIGLRLVAEHTDRFARVVIGNTALATGQGKISKAFLEWQRFAKESPVFPIGKICGGGCALPLSPEVTAGYDAPFPDDTYKAGARIFPSFVPTSPDDPSHDANVAAWAALEMFDRPFLCAFSDSDPMTKGGAETFLRNVPGAAGQAHTTIVGAGHFLQEDKGPEVAQVIIDLIARG